MNCGKAYLIGLYGFSECAGLSYGKHWGITENEVSAYRL